MDTDALPPLDLNAYLARIGYTGDLAPTLTVLEGLHLAHVTHIPFENVDVLLGRPIHLDRESLQAKLVRGKRGGYCFEHNLLFADVLEQLGFAVTRLAARVRFRATRILPRTHMLLRVDVDGTSWLADTGFGGEGLLTPIPMIVGQETRQHDRTYRLVGEDRQHVLQSSPDDAWQDLYVFTQEPQLLVDYEVANYFVSTHPTSIFRQILIAQLPTPSARSTLKGRELVVERHGSVTTRSIEDDNELLAVLAETFGLVLPPETRIPPPVGHL